MTLNYLTFNSIIDLLGTYYIPAQAFFKNPFNSIIDLLQ